MKKNILINCSNLHSGGAVAVSSSVINSLSHFPEEFYAAFDISIICSSEVNKNLLSLNTNFLFFKSYVVKDFYGISALWKGLGKLLRGYDAVFTVFGPAYTLKSVRNHFVGFAQPNIIYDAEPQSSKFIDFERALSRVKYFLQEFFFKNSDFIFVELPHVKKGIKRKWLLKNKKVLVVESAVHSVFLKQSLWDEINFNFDSVDTAIKLGVISKNYPHKNLSVLPSVKKILRDEFNINAIFYVTLTPDEWDSSGHTFRNEIVNVGPLTLSQCPKFYSQLDGVIFPTLLECFSAVPIEALIMKKPLFVSDKPFIHDICSSYANYFNPLDPFSIAISIKKYFDLPLLIRNEVESQAYKYVLKYSNSSLRAGNYLDAIIKNIT